MTPNNGKTYAQFREFGLFEVMPNGFNLYLDDEGLIEDDDSYYAHLEYDLDNDVYKTPETKEGKSFSMTREDVEQSIITYIGSDPMGDLEVCAMWIIPSQAWYENLRQSQKKTIRTSYEMVANEIKSDNPALVNNMNAV